MSEETAQKNQTLVSEALAKIGWHLKDIGCGFFAFVNQHGGRQPLTFYYDRIEIEKDHHNFSICFYLKDVAIVEYRGGGAIGFQGKDNKSIFINCYGVVGKEAEPIETREGF